MSDPNPKPNARRLVSLGMWLWTLVFLSSPVDANVPPGLKMMTVETSGLGLGKGFIKSAAF